MKRTTWLEGWNFYPNLQDWWLNQWPVADDFIHHAYVMELPQKSKRTGFGELLGSEHAEAREWHLARAWGPGAPFRIPSPMHIFHLVVSVLHPL